MIDLIPRRWRRFLGQERNARVASMDPDGPASQIGAQGLFIVGHARSGTTILQDALNDSRDIFLFGEPSFHTDPGTGDFRQRYNEMHRQYRNQETKSTFCPSFFEGDASWERYLVHLAGQHRYVGSKLVVAPGLTDPHCDRIFDFHARHFYGAKYIFIFRNPLDVTVSTQDLWAFQGHFVSPPALFASYLSVIHLYIRMLRLFPSVKAVFHEDISLETFAEIGRLLDIDLHNSISYYSSEKTRRSSSKQIPEDYRTDFERTASLYEQFKTDAKRGFKLAQIAQNNASLDLDGRHFTPLGKLYRAVEETISALTTQSVDKAG